MPLTDEQRSIHMGNAECGARSILVAVMQDLAAIDAHLDRWSFGADLQGDIIETLQTMTQLTRPLRDSLDLAVTSYAMASIDRLKAAGPEPDEFEE